MKSPKSDLPGLTASLHSFLIPFSKIMSTRHTGLGFIMSTGTGLEFIIFRAVDDV